jgi:hypothetical protein
LPERTQRKKFTSGAGPARVTQVGSSCHKRYEKEVAAGKGPNEHNGHAEIRFPKHSVELRLAPRRLTPVSAKK